MRHLILASVLALGTVTTASAQPYPTQPYPAGPFYNPQNIQPNIFNPANQPLSPYLNLLNNGTGNAATRYYYGVRPGTTGGFGLGLGAPFTASGGNRPLFFPQLAAAPDPSQSYDAGPGDVLPPAGHPAVFNTTMGYFPSPFGARGGGGQRTGLAGVGTSGPRPAGR